ncbi:putative efflux pump antibiotic resistance protein [Thelonectria olida]|uniref:Efflux pump antibiotic resistance protein n=1 Tax=Thelonectria olida TaxID=1576542 RepID=A0A9P9AIX1_9HYPO|nr:putative efflux pump antibiotic resistance protein [Thelonectria olida]
MSSGEETARNSRTQSSEQEKVDPTSQGILESFVQPSEDEAAGGGALRERTIHGWKWVATAASLYIGALIYGLDSTIVADIQPALIEEYNEFESLTWAGTGFPLGSFCSILPGAALYAIFDLKYMFIGSIILFEAASALCGAAPTMDALIVGRVFAGVGGNGIFLGILNYFSLITADTERGRYISGMGVTWGIGAVLGPVVGGAFATSSATWRWAFYINLVIAAVCAPVYIFWLPMVKPGGDHDRPALSKFASLDWVGFTLATGAMVSFTMVLTFAGATWPWDDSRTIALFVVMGVLFILTFLQQYFVLFTTPEDRMVPPSHVLLNPTQVLLYINTAVAATNIYVPLFYLPLYFAFTRGDSTMQAAVRLLPFIAFLASGTMFSGSMLPKINYYWTIYLAGGILMTIGAATMYTVDSSTPTGNVYGYSILLGAGTGIVFNLGFTVASITMLQQTGSGLDVQRVSSMQNLSQLGWQLISLLIGGQVMQELSFRNLSKVLDGMGFTEREIRQAAAGTSSDLFDSLSPSVQDQAINAITDAINKIYILSIISGAAMVVVTIFLPKKPLFPKQEEKTDAASSA